MERKDVRFDGRLNKGTRPLSIESGERLKAHLTGDSKNEKTSSSDSFSSFLGVCIFSRA